MRIIYGLLPLVLPELELRCGAGSQSRLHREGYLILRYQLRYLRYRRYLRYLR